MPNPVIAAAMQAELAELAAAGPLAPVPEGPLGYGRDLSCVIDCTADYAETDPHTTRGLGESLLRQLTTPRGTVIDAPGWGIDIRAWTSVGVTDRQMQSYGDQICGEVGKDDRVESSDCGVEYDPPTNTLRFTLRVTAVDPAIGVFTLTFAVTPDGAALLESIG